MSQPAAATRRPSPLASVLLAGVVLVVLWLPGGRPSRAVPLAACPYFDFKDWHLSGEAKCPGWKGTATCELEGGHTVKLGASGDAGVDELVAAMKWKSPCPSPDIDLSMTYKPGTAKPVAGSNCPVAYAARFTKAVPKCPYAPVLGATLKNTGVWLDAEAKHAITDKANVGMKLELPYTYSSKSVDPTMIAEAGYKVGGGELVGTLTTKASGGTHFTATYKLG